MILCELDISESGAEYASEATEYFDCNTSRDTTSGKQFSYITYR